MSTTPLPPESEEGNVEYKLIVKGDADTICGLQSQMKCRLFAGNGKAVYWVGVMDCGEKVGINIIDESLQNLDKVVSGIGASITSIIKTQVPLEMTCTISKELYKWVPPDQPRWIARVDVTHPSIEIPPLYLGEL